ncbi:monovalent cation/H(+) antiporter subunit G [Actinomadura barringtoniae]|uniref:Monovalent cation/H(+) antiporter subunit G n=1 Tax=Actinomadura barringtoniae TaxID=1427535 RepID=A0A939PBH1_9ACTN|nr:monovalent cation/H(+) antiporter subunit G [Actinomadura barringtoniae]MBO2449525.1 monovalent cation/H(+) antiporter subunit G [Actinomadura barringtoniae]
MREAVGAVLVWAGAGLAVLCGVRLLFTRGPAARLHVIAPVTVLAAPLVAVGLALRSWSSWHDVAKLALIAALLVATGPATVVTAGRAVRKNAR